MYIQWNPDFSGLKLIRRRLNWGENYSKAISRENTFGLNYPEVWEMGVWDTESTITVTEQIQGKQLRVRVTGRVGEIGLPL